MSILRKLKLKDLQKFFFEKIESQFSLKPDGERVISFNKDCVVFQIITPISKKILLEIWANESMIAVRYIHRILFQFKFDGKKLLKDWKDFLKDNLKCYNETDYSI